MKKPLTQKKAVTTSWIEYNMFSVVYKYMQPYRSSTIYCGKNHDLAVAIFNLHQSIGDKVVLYERPIETRKC